MSPLVFVMPDGSDEISGGNLYNAQLFAALQGQAPIVRMGVAEFASEPLAAGTYLVDTLNLDVARTVLERRSSGQHFVLLVHHLPSLEPGLDPAHPSLATEKAVLGHFDGYLATGEFTRGWLAKQRLAERVLLLEPPMPASKAPARSFSGPLRALMVCNLIARKGVLEFLGALLEGFGDGSEVAGREFHLDIVGRGDLDAEYGEACAKRVDSSPVLREHVTLLGSVPHEAMPARYEAANLFLSASQMETFGISLQEARHYGLPILAVRGGNSEHHLEAGRTGELFSSPRALALGLLRLIRDTESHGQLFYYAQALRPQSGESWDAGAARFLAALETWFPAS